MLPFLAVVLLGACSAYPISKTWNRIQLGMLANGKGRPQELSGLPPCGIISKRGGPSDVRNGEGLTARAVGEAGMLVPRTGEAGATLNATLYYPPPSVSSPLNVSEQASATHNAVFVSRLSGAHESSPTAFQNENAPLGLTTHMIPHPPPTIVPGCCGFSHVFLGLGHACGVLLRVDLHVVCLDRRVDGLLFTTGVLSEAGTGVPRPPGPVVCGLCLTGHGIQRGHSGRFGVVLESTDVEYHLVGR